ncbi:MAG: N-acetyl-gamma-glutamyl-phosphate reductase [Armatimonadota bacterium]|nr:N-acetyl-gamma-glutamyl-phosphate reductase [Armatimonadota bacterium]
MVRVGVIGALGYGGGELVRILTNHPHVKLTYLCSELEKPVRISDVCPGLKGILDANCEVYDPNTAIEQCDILFIAQHPGWAMKHARRFLDTGIKVIDLSADFRLRNPENYEQWYKIKHESPELIQQAVYGLPELYRSQIAQAKLIANPGCFPTGAILALMPLLREKLVDPDTIIVDSKTGASGAGRMAHKLDFHFPELNESMKPYNVGVHRHTPEIEQELTSIAGCQVTISFTPHLVPITRGILTTAYARLIDTNMTTENLVDIYRQHYADDYFVVVLNAGEYPATKNTYGSNFCQIGLKVDERTGRVVVISAIDNLVKGMAGEAVQNMNLMCGFDEKTALDRPAVFP